MNRKKWLTILGGTVVSAMLVTGCGANDTNDPPPADDNGTSEINNLNRNDRDNRIFEGNNRERRTDLYDHKRGQLNRDGNNGIFNDRQDNNDRGMNNNNDGNPFDNDNNDRGIFNNDNNGRDNDGNIFDNDNNDGIFNNDDGNNRLFNNDLDDSDLINDDRSPREDTFQDNFKQNKNRDR